MPNAISSFWKQENGQDMVEYSLLIGFVALSGAAVLTGVRTEMTSIWNAISTSFATAASS